MLELVDGESLTSGSHAARFLSMALGIARQIAEAIEAAHAVDHHRDLKPANIALTTDGNAGARL